MENDDDGSYHKTRISNNSSQGTLILDADDADPFYPVESPTSHRSIKVVDNFESPTRVQEFNDSTSRCDDGCESSDLDNSNRSEGSHLSLQEMVSNTLSQIDGVLGEIMNESSDSNLLKRRSNENEEDDEDILARPTYLRASSTQGTLALDSLQSELTNAEKEEKQKFKKTVMANVERISTELEETRKNEEELKSRIDKLREQLAQRRAQRNRIINANKIVEHSVKSLPPASQENKPKERQPSKEKVEKKAEEKAEEKADDNQERGSWLFMFRARRRAQREKAEKVLRESIARN